jgi:hypothetical protein
LFFIISLIIVFFPSTNNYNKASQIFSNNENLLFYTIDGFVKYPNNSYAKNVKVEFYFDKEDDGNFENSSTFTDTNGYFQFLPINMNPMPDDGDNYYIIIRNNTFIGYTDGYINVNESGNIRLGDFKDLDLSNEFPIFTYSNNAIHISDPSPSPNKEIKITIRLKNEGNKHGLGKIRFYLNDPDLDGLFIDEEFFELDAGSSKEITFLWTTRAGNHTLFFKIYNLATMEINNLSKSIKVNKEEKGFWSSTYNTIMFLLAIIGIIATIITPIYFSRIRKKRKSNNFKPNKNDENYIKVADEVWIATALLHKENLKQKSFSVKEIVNKVKQENIFGKLRPGIKQYIYSDCVANIEAKSGNYRILIKIKKGRYRLYKDSDKELCHPSRNGKTIPDKHEIPKKYQKLLKWYKEEYNQ